MFYMSRWLHSHMRPKYIFKNNCLSETIIVIRKQTFVWPPSDWLPGLSSAIVSCPSSRLIAIGLVFCPCWCPDLWPCCGPNLWPCCCPDRWPCCWPGRWPCCGPGRWPCCWPGRGPCCGPGRWHCCGVDLGLACGGCFCCWPFAFPTGALSCWSWVLFSGCWGGVMLVFAGGDWIGDGGAGVVGLICPWSFSVDFCCSIGPFIVSAGPGLGGGSIGWFCCCCFGGVCGGPWLGCLLKLLFNPRRFWFWKGWLLIFGLPINPPRIGPPTPPPLRGWKLFIPMPPRLLLNRDIGPNAKKTKKNAWNVVQIESNASYPY